MQRVVWGFVVMTRRESIDAWQEVRRAGSAARPRCRRAARFPSPAPHHRSPLTLTSNHPPGAMSRLPPKPTSSAMPPTTSTTAPATNASGSGSLAAIDAELLASGLVRYQLQPPSWRAPWILDRPETGVPQFYPTVKGQDEDMMGEANVKQGFGGKNVVQVSLGRGTSPRCCSASGQQRQERDEGEGHEWGEGCEGDDG